jgi:hypothetical protein
MSSDQIEPVTEEDPRTRPNNPQTPPTNKTHLKQHHTQLPPDRDLGPHHYPSLNMQTMASPETTMRTRSRADTMMRRCQNGPHDIDGRLRRTPSYHGRPRAETCPASPEISRRPPGVPLPHTVTARETAEHPHHRPSHRTSDLYGVSGVVVGLRQQQSTDSPDWRPEAPGPTLMPARGTGTGYCPVTLEESRYWGPLPAAIGQLRPRQACA